MKRHALLLAKLAVSLALLAYLLSTSDLRALGERVRNADVLLVCGALLVYCAMLGLAMWRWRLLLTTQGFPAPLRELGASYLVASFFNNFLPTNIGGDVVRVRDSSRLTGSTTTSLAVVVIDRVLGFGALFAVATAAFAAGGPQVRSLLGAREVLLLLGIVFAGLAYVFFRPGTTGKALTATRLARIEPIRRRFETVRAAVHVYRARVVAVLVAFGASVALQGLLVVYFFAVAHALQIPLGLEVALLIVPLCTLVQAVPISFNGWGVRESLFIVYFHQVGLGRDSALAVSLVGTGLIVLLSLSGAVVWTTRGALESA